MKVVIRNPRRAEVELKGPMTVGEILAALRLSPESHLVIRNDEVLTRDIRVEDNEQVEILSAISGGSA